MTTEEIKKTVRQMIDSLESMHEELLAYGQQLTSTDQTAFTFYLHNNEAETADGVFDEH